MTTVPPIPPGYHTLTPYLVVYDALAAIEFYKRAFGAVVNRRLTTPDGQLVHAEIQIGDSRIMLGSECRDYGQFAPTGLGGSPVSLHLYVDNVDAAFEKAVLAGARITMPVAKMFWGDRYGTLRDPYGHNWSIASRVEELSEAQMQTALAKMENCGVPA